MENDDFEKILQDFDAAEQHGARERSARRAHDSASIEKFAGHVNAEIEPALTAVGLMVQRHDHDYKVRLHDSKQNVAFEFFFRGIPSLDFGGDNTPTLVFAWNTTKRRVLVHSRNVSPGSGGDGGPRGEYEMEALTAEVVRDLAMKLVQEVLAMRSRI